jgi:hypothetical protein
MEQDPKYHDWYAKESKLSYFRKELLSVRFRADCDPILCIAQRAHLLQTERRSATLASIEGIDPTGDDAITTNASRREVEYKLSSLFDDVGDDALLTNMIANANKKVEKIVRSLIADKLIAHRSTGKKAAAAVSFTVPTAARKNAAGNKNQVVDPVSGPMYPRVESSIAGITKKRKKCSPGNNKGIPLEKMKWCEWCGVWRSGKMPHCLS